MHTTLFTHFVELFALFMKQGHQEINSKPYGILAGIKENEIFKKGTWGADFYSGMKPVDGDIVASGKRGLCGFATTNLDFILRQNNCKNIVLAGFLTNCCVESTMRSGYELGYNGESNMYKNFLSLNRLFV